MTKRQATPRQRTNPGATAKRAPAPRVRKRARRAEAIDPAAAVRPEITRSRKAAENGAVYGWV